MNKKKWIPFALIAIAVLAALCITFIVLCQGDGSPSAGDNVPGTGGMTDQTPGSSSAGTDGEVDLGDLLNPDGDSATGEDTPSGDTSPDTDGEKPADPVLPDGEEGDNDGYSNGWY